MRDALRPGAACSPPTRRCTGRGCFGERRSGVLLADVGMAPPEITPEGCPVVLVDQRAASDAVHRKA